MIYYYIYIYLSLSIYIYVIGSKLDVWVVPLQ
jgi:hypothetical protein